MRAATTTRFVHRVVRGGLVLAVAITAGGCVSAELKIDDLQLVGLRKLDAKERTAHPEHVPLNMQGRVYDRTVFVEATLSTSFDLVAAAQSGGWRAYARKWRCAFGRDDGWMAGLFEDVYQDGKAVMSPSSNSITQPRAPTGGRHIYAIYFSANDSGPGRGAPYNLGTSAVDVCVELAEATHYGSALKTNVVTIPAQALATLLADERR